MLLGISRADIPRSENCTRHWESYVKRLRLATSTTVWGACWRRAVLTTLHPATVMLPQVISSRTPCRPVTQPGTTTCPPRRTPRPQSFRPTTASCSLAARCSKWAKQWSDSAWSSSHVS